MSTSNDEKEFILSASITEEGAENSLLDNALADLSVHHVESNLTFNPILPSPIKFARKKILSTGTFTQFCCHGILLSLIKPHKIIEVSADFLRLFGFNSNQIRGHSLMALFGPLTNSISVSAAIKNTGNLLSSEMKTILYASSGQELNISATFVPFKNTLDGSIGGCLMRVDYVFSVESGDKGNIFLVDDFLDPHENVSKSKILSRAVWGGSSAQFY